MLTLTAEDRRTLAAAAARILPDASDGPGAREAGVLEYIVRALDSPWGQGAQMYRHEPYAAPADIGHGWQSPLTPAGAFQYGLTALNSHTLAGYGVRFEELPDAAQDDVLRQLEMSEVATFAEISGGQFFELLRQHVIEGLLADPANGGNHEGVGWRWIGYSPRATLRAPR